MLRSSFSNILMASFTVESHMFPAATSSSSASKAYVDALERSE